MGGAFLSFLLKTLVSKGFKERQRVLELEIPEGNIRGWKVSVGRL